MITPHDDRCVQLHLRLNAIPHIMQRPLQILLVHRSQLQRKGPRPENLEIGLRPLARTADDPAARLHVLLQSA